MRLETLYIVTDEEKFYKQYAKRHLKLRFYTGNVIEAKINVLIDMQETFPTQHSMDRLHLF